MTFQDYCIVSLHEEGFWQIDCYWKMEQPPVEGDIPDHFKTCAMGQPMEAATKWCADWYPNAIVLIADDDDEQEDDDD